MPSNRASQGGGRVKRTRDELLNDLRDAVFLALGEGAFAYRSDSMFAADPSDIVRLRLADVLDQEDDFWPSTKGDDSCPPAHARAKGKQ